ncbi:MAG: stage sporulation protein [Moorella sp. (in: firmicutes)]|uniref:Stage II sporulation protein SpoIIR n=1 Tax=Neomoorella thermoacetica TaxID=1525 RepID=A0A1J5NMH3_NEOTH|nr:stage sporulation protein [Moorella sp. (in: firmicutes)]OIQ59496.1 stage II sporulation protein SpoIIR [Moorella thermoacetica]
MSRWKKSLLAILLAGIVIIAGGSTWQENRIIPAYNSHNLIRLHVIANSDTPGDQELKRHVRDAVLASVGQRLAGAGDITTARQLVSTNLATITAAAEAQIKREGRSYTVRTEFGDFPFPTRAYGDITLPAGNYEAVRLVIGEGRGQNWWCVLFPPLCLVDVASKGHPGQVAAGPPAIVAGTASEAGPAPDAFQVRWKIIEVFKTSRRYLASLWP